MNKMIKAFFFSWLFVVCMFSRAAETPGILFDSSDISMLRGKIDNEPFQSMFWILKGEAEKVPQSDYEEVYFAINNAFLYVLTGKEYYSDSSLRACLYLTSLDEWANDNFRSLGRAMYAKGVALAYDMCKNAWSYETDTLISGKLVKMGESLKRSGGSGWPSGPGNNWRAVRYSGMGLCFLAADYIDENYRESEISYAFDQIMTYFNANLSELPDAMGWNPEGIGYTIYPAEFWALFNIGVKRRYPGKDLLNTNNAVKHTLATIYRVAILQHNGTGRKGYHPDLSDDNMNLGSSGVFGLAFENSQPDYIPAFKWFYNRLTGPKGDLTFDKERGGIVFSYLYYPYFVKEKNPIDDFGLNFLDPAQGIVLFRNKFQDSTDIVALHNAKQRAPKHCHGGADVNGFRIWGLGGCWTTGAGRIGSLGSPGQTTILRYDPAEKVEKSSETGKLVKADFFKDGSGYSIIKGSSTLLPFHKRTFITDYSGESGSPGFFIICDSTIEGRLWRLNTVDVNTIARDDSTFIITAPNGNRMIGKILHGLPYTARTGDFERGSGYIWNGNYHESNKWLDFQSSDDNYVLVLFLLEKGTPIPEVRYYEIGHKKRIIAGNRVVEIQSDSVKFLTLEDILNAPVKQNLHSSHIPTFNVFPNPASNSVTINLNSLAKIETEISLHDYSGRKLYTIYKGVPEPGTTLISWVATEGLTNTLQDGAYFFRYTNAEGFARSEKVIISRN